VKKNQVFPSTDTTRFISIRDLTFMGDIVFLIGDHQVRLSPGDDPIVDENVILESREYTFDGFNLTRKKDAGHVFIDIPRKYTIKVMDIEWSKYDTNFHNVKVTNHGRRGEGIIGSTWREQVDVESLEQNYHIESLIDTEYPLSLFYCGEVREHEESVVWIGEAHPPTLEIELSPIINK